jgi:integrase
MHVAELLSPSLLFPRAFCTWIDSLVIRKAGVSTNAQYIGVVTERDYRQYAKALEKMFEALRLEDIHEGHLREYHRARALNDGPWAKPAGANLINKEVGMLIRMLREAGLWDKNRDDAFNRLQHVETDVQRALNQEEERNFLKTAASREDWRFVYNYSIAALQTTASTNEMRSLRIGDVSLAQGVIQIRARGAKNRFRIRTIPIETQECRWAFEALIYRAYQLGAGGEHHFLFPIQQVRNTYDPTRPMGNSGLKKRWDEVRKAAGLPWLRPYDLRHTAITRMAESGVPIPVILSFAGHVSQKMQQHYTQISLMAQRRAAALTWSSMDFAPKKPVARDPRTGFDNRSLVV